MEEKYIDPIAVAVKYVFKAMLNIEIEQRTPFVKETKKSTGDITGVMALAGIEGDNKGTISFSTSTQGALAIYKKLMQQSFEKITAEIIDGMGELTNIISGRIRYELEKLDIHLYAHVPIIFVGKNAEVNFITKMSVVSIPFHFVIDGTGLDMNVDFVFE